MSKPPFVLVYLATPYSHYSARVQEARFLAVTEYAAKGWAQGYGVYSPVTLTHEAAIRHGLPKDWKFWGELCRATIERHHELWVLCLPGWRESVGVKAEIDLARSLGLPIRYFVPESRILCSACPYAIELTPDGYPCSWIACPFLEIGLEDERVAA